MYAGLLKQLQPAYKRVHAFCGINVENLEQYANNLADVIGQSKAMIRGLKAQVGSLQIDIEKSDTKYVGLQKELEMMKNVRTNQSRYSFLMHSIGCK
jgi:hypothetical protein